MKYIKVIVIAALLSVSFNSYSFAQFNQKNKAQLEASISAEAEAFLKRLGSYVDGLSAAQKSKISEIFKRVKSENDADWAKRPKAESLDAAKWASEYSKRSKAREDNGKQAMKALLNDKQKKRFENAEYRIFAP